MTLFLQSQSHCSIEQKEEGEAAEFEKAAQERALDDGVDYFQAQGAADRERLLR